STTSLSNGTARTLPRCCVACSMNAIRSSASNSERLLRTDALTTAMMSSSNIVEAREMMSMWPLVTGSYEPGQTARRGSGAIDANEGVAVAAFVVEGQAER